MATCRINLFVILIFMLVIGTLLMADSEALYIPKSRAAAAAGEILKRSSSIVHRQKRYTDYQERASAFCTGLCMYEERKSYSECFDLCNWHLSQNSQYIAPQRSENSFYAGPLASTTSTTDSTTTYSDPDYSNDEGANGVMPEFTTQGQGQSMPEYMRTGNSKLGGRRRKGKKQKGNKNKGKGQTSAQQKRLLRELKRKLLRQIDDKQAVLSEKALSLEQKIGGLETEIESSKQIMVDFEERLQHIRSEMADIDGLKANVSVLIKGGRKLASGRQLKSDELLPGKFLLPETEFADEDVAKVLEEFLVKEHNAKRGMFSPMDMSHDLGFDSLDSDRTEGASMTTKRRDLGDSAAILEAMMSNQAQGDYVPGGP